MWYKGAAREGSVDEEASQSRSKTLIVTFPFTDFDERERVDPQGFTQGKRFGAPLCVFVCGTV